MAHSPVAPQTGSPNIPEVYRIGETVCDLEIALTAKLGQNPLISDTGDCNLDTLATEGKESEMIRRLGWIVTSATSANGYHAVSFADKLDMGTSGSCFVTDANVAIFRDGEMQALIYEASDSFDGITLVSKSPTALIRLSGDVVNYSSPIADVLVENNIISIIPLPARETLCGGTITVPNIRNRTIITARKTRKQHQLRRKVLHFGFRNSWRHYSNHQPHPSAHPR